MSKNVHLCHPLRDYIKKKDLNLGFFCHRCCSEERNAGRGEQHYQKSKLQVRNIFGKPAKNTSI